MLSKELIGRRRRQLLVHSYIYYRLNTNIISDDQWDLWAQELIQLQEDYPEESKEAPLYNEFIEFDGSTGIVLPLYGQSLHQLSQRILSYKPQTLCYNENISKKEELKLSKAKWLTESTVLELLMEVEKVTENKKALKAIEELKERAPKDVQGPVALFEQIIELATKGIAEYEGEVTEIAEYEEEVVEEVPSTEDEDLDELTVKELRSIARDMDVYEKGMRKAELIKAIEEGETEEEETEEEEPEFLKETDDDIEELSLAELRTLARELGVFERGMKRDDLIEAIEEEEEEEFYDEMNLKELKSEARERGIRVTSKMSEDDIIDLLIEDDEV